MQTDQAEPDPRPATGLVPWWPQPLAAALAAEEAGRVQAAGGDPGVLTADLSYLLVEELTGRVALLQRWVWPDADDVGRLVWRMTVPIEEVAVPQELLRWQLYEATVLTRQPRPGDVFAVRWLRPQPADPPPQVRDLRELFVDVYDLSADAREAAKVAYGATLVDVLELGDIPAPGDALGRGGAAIAQPATSGERQAAPVPRLVLGSADRPPTGPRR